MSRAHFQALQVHLDREEKKEPGDEEDREVNLETKEIKALWGHQERVASKASGDLLGCLAKLVLRVRKERQVPQACRDRKENLANHFQHLPLLSRVTVNESGSATFQCSATGNPQPAVVWSKLPNQLQISQSAVTGGILSLQNVKGSDAGLYKCSAANVLGHAHALGHLVVNGEFMNLLFHNTSFNLFRR